MNPEPMAEIKKVFVDRTMELASIHTALKVASSGKGRAILIEGEAGIGKTALIERFLKDVEDVNVRKTECIYGEIEPYAPIKRLMEQKEVDVIKKEMPLLGIMPVPSSPKEKKMENLEDERERMFEVFINFVKKSSKKKTTIYVIDNLQWMDESSAKLMIRTLPRLESSKILLIMAYRPVDVQKDSPVEDLISRAKILEMSSTIKLKRLGQPDVAEMIREMLNRTDIPKSFINTVYRDTEGNPLFVRELINSLIQEGIIDPSSYKGIDNIQIRIPPSVKEVLLRRVAKLSPDTKKVLNYAAIIGIRFDFETLRNLTGMDEEKLLDAIDELLEAGIIEEDETTDEEVYFFTYIQIKEIVERSLSKSRRRVMHKKIGEFMEKNGYDAYSIAEHFLKGGVYDKAYKYSLEAAKKSMETLGFESAVKYYTMALQAFENMKEKDEGELLDILMGLGNLYKSLGKWDEAMQTYKKALEIAEKLGDDEAMVDINFGMGDIEKSRGRWDAADIFFEAAGKISERIGDIHRLGEAERSLGHVHWRKGEYVDAVNHFTEAISHAKETNDSAMAGRIFIDMGNLYSDMGNLEKAIDYYQKSIPRLKKVKDYREIGRALNNLGDSYMQLEDWKKAIEYFARSEDAAAKTGDLNMIAWSMFNAGEAYARKGEVDKAKKYCDEAYEMLERMGDKVGLAAIHRVYGIIAQQEKDWEHAIKHLKKSVSMLRELDIPHLLALSLFEMGNAYAGKGDKKSAEKHYKEALEIFEKIKSKNNADKVKKALESLK